MSNARFEVALNVDFDRQAGPNTPVRARMDFEKLIASAGKQGLVDPHTIIVKRRVSGKTKRYDVQVDEHLYYRNQGWVAWLADDPQAGGRWSMEFSLRSKDGRLAQAPYRPMVGVGDEIFYNGDRWRPIATPGMHQFPIAIDWNGDGLIDIISTSHYSNVQGMPWAGVFFWRNIGGNAKPRFAPPYRLCADGVDLTDPSKTHWKGEWKFAKRRDFISEYYIRVDFFDWFGTGRQDLVTVSRQGQMRVYRNTGRLDEAGLPVLQRAVDIAIPKVLPPTPYLGLRVVDWDGSGRPSFILGSPYVEAGIDNGQIWLMRNVGGTPERPKFKSFPLPRSSFWRPKARYGDWRTINNFPDGRAFSFDWFDVDGDGSAELLILHGNHRPEPAIEVWRNAGTADEPRMTQDGFLPWSVGRMSCGFRFVRNAAFDGCLVGTVNSGGGMRYFKRTGENPYDARSYKDAGLLLGEGGKVRPEGYVRAWPIDVDGDGKMDLVCGDEPGFITLVKNVGTRDRPAYDNPRRLCDNRGNVLHLRRENILHDNDLEWSCGQLKPLVCDWDGDGKLDLIVGNNTNRILWLRGYDPQRNRFTGMHELKVRGMLDPFGWRKGQIVLDFDGDGRLELITADWQYRVCMYRQSTESPLLLEPPTPLTYTNGKPIMVDTIPPAIYKYGMISLDAVDWTGNGVYDLIVSTNYMSNLLENVGTNQQPKFKKPKPFTTPDGPIEICHHDSHAKAVDWDGDGRDDLLIGGESGTMYLFHRDWLAGIMHRVESGEVKPIR